MQVPGAQELHSPVTRTRMNTFMSSMKAGKAAIDMKVRKATMKKSSAARLNTSFQESPSWKYTNATPRHSIKYIARRIQKTPTLRRLQGPVGQAASHQAS